MSTVKNPKAKKELSLKRDRRNSYGECPTSSRRNIRLGKQRSHQDERRTVSEVLGHLKGKVEEDQAADAQSLATTRSRLSRGKGFKKQPDRSLEVTIAIKSARQRRPVNDSLKQVQQRLVRKGFLSKTLVQVD